MLFPLFVIIIAFLAVNFIRPAVLSVLDQRLAKEAKLAELSAVERTAANIGALSESREALLSSDDGKLVMSYLPVRSDHDRIVDVLNYLALGSGAIIGAISFDAGTAVPAPVPVAEVVGADGLPVQTPPQTPTPSMFSVTMEASGTYDSLKSFMEKVSSVNRLQKITSFSLSKQESSSTPGADGQAPSDNGTLSAQIEVGFMYLPEASYPTAHLLPIFTAGNFDMESVASAMSSAGSIPALPEPALPGRRPDPFKF